MYVYIYIYIHTCICISISLYLSISLSLYIYIYMSLPANVGLNFLSLPTSDPVLSDLVVPATASSSTISHIMHVPGGMIKRLGADY